MSAPEVRSFLTEVRALEDESGRWIVGYGIVFNEWSQDLGGFRERVNPAAADGSLAADMVVCGNHDPNNVLGRVSAGTVRISTDAHGVEYRALVNESDPMAVSFYERVKRGDIIGSSFSFWVDRDRWFVEDGQTCREILAFKAVDEMGPVTFPAYLQTSAEARDAASATRAETFDETLAENDAARAASWTRFYQMEYALEDTILDVLYTSGEESRAAAAADDFAAAVKAWVSEHMARFGAWYPSASERMSVESDVERRVALIVHEEREDAPSSETDVAHVDVPDSYFLGLRFSPRTPKE